MSIIHKFRMIFPRRTKIQLLFLLAGIIAGALLETIALSIISPFISLLLDSSIMARNNILSFVYNLLGFRSAIEFLAFLAFMLAFVYIFRGAYLFFLNKIQFKFLSTQQIRLSDRMLNIILRKPYLFHANHNFADLSRVVLGDVAVLFAMILAALSFLSDFFMTVFILAFLLTVSLPMTVVVLLLSFICVFFYLRFFRRKIRDIGEVNRNKSIAMYKAVNQALSGIKEIKVLHREDFFINAFKQSSDEYIKSNQRFQVYNSLPRLFIESVCFGGAFVLMGILIGTGTDLEALVPQLSVFVLAAFRLLPAVSRLTTYVSTILFNKVSIDSIYDYISKNDESYEEQINVAYTEIEKSEDIIVRNITFQYPNVPEPVLEDASLRIPHTQSVAFVGSSGAGKTTLVDIILGIYNPMHGMVSYGGYNIHQNPEKWVQNVGYIPQQIYLLDDTITNNIAFGIADEKINRDQVWSALEQAQLKDFVLSLPDGLNTIVGDRGVRLSGGQRQRIGIARALYNNPSILILDEATSSLDTETESAVMDAINSFQGTKTMVIIAHRLSTIEHCDLIYRVQDGIVTLER